MAQAFSRVLAIRRQMRHQGVPSGRSGGKRRSLNQLGFGQPTRSFITGVLAKGGANSRKSSPKYAEASVCSQNKNQRRKPSRADKLDSPLPTQVAPDIRSVSVNRSWTRLKWVKDWKPTSKAISHAQIRVEQQILGFLDHTRE
jgi:hypothetical protein